MKSYIFCYYLLLIFIYDALAQEEKKSEDIVKSIFLEEYDTPLTLEKKEEEGMKVKLDKKEIPKPNFYFGKKTKRRKVYSFRGSREYVEIFHVLKKDFYPPPPYTRDYYWFDRENYKIVNSLKSEKDRSLILHGPYQKKIDTTILEEGWYYMGRKHRRWMKYDQNDILLDKKYWWKGWTQESLLSYYDFKKTKIKEVIPIHNKERNGEYWAFHKNGFLAVRGTYKFGKRVGLWKEYYDNKRLKREFLYPKNPFDESELHGTLIDIDYDGQILYNSKKRK